jgi:hypothetical protein
MSDDKPPPFTTIIDEDEPASPRRRNAFRPTPSLLRAGQRALTTRARRQTPQVSAIRKKTKFPLPPPL